MPSIHSKSKKNVNWLCLGSLGIMYSGKSWTGLSALTAEAARNTHQSFQTDFCKLVRLIIYVFIYLACSIFLQSGETEVKANQTGFAMLVHLKFF